MGPQADRPVDSGKRAELVENLEKSDSVQVKDKADVSRDLAWYTALEKESYEFASSRFRKKESNDNCPAQSNLPGLELLKPQELKEESNDKIALQERITALSNKYNVRISGAGNKAEYESSSEGNINVELRNPTLRELEIIERVLDKSLHLSKKRKDGQIDFGGLKIGFAAQSESGRIQALGWHDSESEPPGVYFAPKNDRDGRTGLESTALHEFAHQLQKQFWEDRHGNELPPRSFVKFFGYEKVPESQSKMDGGTYMLTDKYGRKWQHESEGVSECEQDDYWFPVENGKVLIDRNKAIIDEELRNRLPDHRKPASSYFPDPSEAHAEALAMLLFNRKMLYARNPKLYELMKVLDQNDINRRFGFHKSEGRMQPLMIRNLDGKIVPNQSSERTLLKEAEKQWAAADLTSLKEDPPDKAEEHASCSCHKTQASRKNKASPKN